MADEPGAGIEMFCLNVNTSEFLQILAILEQQPRLLNSFRVGLPLVRENIEVP